MKNNSYDLFMETLHQKEPERKVLAKELMELLNIEKEAVYRRLRQDVMFSFTEIEAIACKYQISMDHIILNYSPNDMTFYLMDYDFVNTPAENIAFTKEFIDEVSKVKDDPNSELGFAVNTIPLSLVRSAPQRNMYYFAIYKWMYQYGRFNPFPNYGDLELPEQLLYFNDQYRKAITHANYTCYVLDESIFHSLVKDILYFKSVKYISDAEIKLLKEETLDFLDDLEELTIKGEFPTGKRVDFYITQMSIESSYSYIKSEHTNHCFVKLFSVNDITSSSARNVPRFGEWLQSLKKSSSQISVSGELQRIWYFNRQREIINQL